MRLLVYGMVVVLGFGVFALRGSDDDSKAAKEPVSVLYQGETPEGLRTVLSATDGKVHSAKLKWKMACENRKSYVSTVTFAPVFGDRFEYSGREFRINARAEQGPRPDRKVRYDISVSGSLSPNGKSASGSGRTSETWIENGRVVDRCVSDRVPWTVHRGLPVRG